MYTYPWLDGFVEVAWMCLSIWQHTRKLFLSKELLPGLNVTPAWFYTLRRSQSSLDFIRPSHVLKSRTNESVFIFARVYGQPVNQVIIVFLGEENGLVCIGSQSASSTWQENCPVLLPYCRTHGPVLLHEKNCQGKLILQCYHGFITCQGKLILWFYADLVGDSGLLVSIHVSRPMLTCSSDIASIKKWITYHHVV